jgi:hypothetical protein
MRLQNYSELSLHIPNTSPAANLNDEYRMTIDEFLTRFEYHAQAIDAVDEAARKEYQLASFSITMRTNRSV